MRGSLKKNAILNVIKQLCAVLFPLITIPYITHILGPENYGKITFSSSIISYFILIAGLGVSNYAIREGAKIREDKNKINKFANEVFSINIISTFIAYFSLFIFIIISSKMNDYRNIIVIQSISLLLTTIGVDWINSVYEDYTYLTIRYLIFQFISIICLFIFVRNQDDYIIYSIISLFAVYGGNVLNIFYIRRYVKLKFTLKLNLKNHIKPILYLFFSSVATTIYVYSDSTILGYLLNDFDVGVYGLASKIYLVVKQVLNAIIIVSLPRLSFLLKIDDNVEFEKLCNKIYNLLIIIVLPTIVGLFLLSNDAMRIVGGDEYISGGNSLKILSVSLLFSVFAGFFCCSIMLPFKKEKYFLISSIIGAVVNISFNFIVIRYMGITGAAITTMLSEFIVFIIYLIISYRLIKLKLNVKNLVLTLLGCFYILIIFLLTFKYLEHQIYTILLIVIVGALGYFIIHLIFRNDIIFPYYSNIICKFKTIISKIKTSFSTYIKGKKNDRNSGIEILKIISIILIIMSHSVPFYGPDSSFYINLNEASTSYVDIMFIVIRYMGQLGNVVFIICSSYYLLNKTSWNFSKIFKIIIDSFIISVSIYAMYFAYSKEFNLNVAIKQFLPITFNNNWFVTCYLLFCLIYPILNVITKQLKRTVHLFIILVLAILYCGVSFVLNGAYYFNFLIGFIVIYFIVSYWRLYIQNNPKYNSVFYFILMSVMICLLVGIILFTNYIGLKYSIFSNQLLRWNTFINPLIIFIGISLFALFYKIRFFSKLINYFSSLSLFIYMIHENYCIREYIKPMFFNSFSGSVWQAFFLLLSINISCSFLLAILYDITIGFISYYSSKKFTSFSYILYNKIENKLDRCYESCTSEIEEKNIDSNLSVFKDTDERPNPENYNYGVSCEVCEEDKDDKN